MATKTMSFEDLMKGFETVTTSIDREEVVKQLVAEGKAKILRDLNVRNVTITPYENSTLISITTDKPVVVGDTAGEPDEFGQPTVKLGLTRVIQTSSFAMANILKDNYLTAIFAGEVAAGSDITKLILSGGKVAIVMEYIPANTEWSNPFSTSGKVSVWDRDKVIHHVIGVEPGPLAQRLLDAKLAQF